MIKGINEREGIEKSLKKQFTWKLNATRLAQSQAKPWRDLVKSRKRKEKNERKPNPGVMCSKNKRKERLKIKEWEVRPNSNVLHMWPTTNNK